MSNSYPPPPAAPGVTPLDQAIHKAATDGWTVVNRDSHNAVLNKGGKVRHVMHGIISLLTCGVWLWGWAIVAILGAKQMMTLSMDANGHVTQQGPKSRSPYLAGVAGLFVVLAVIAALTGGGGEDTTATNGGDSAAQEAPVEEAAAPAKDEEKAKPKPKAKPMVVSTEDLIKEFQDSEFTADKKYKGKTLKITGGVVSSIDAQIFDDEKYDVSFDSGGEFEILSVNCRSVAAKYLDTLEPGQEVTVVGKFDDGGDLGIEMKSCDF